MNLKIENLSKHYKNKKALDKFSVELTPGLYGILGPNGAGKTTLISIITGLISQSEGSIYYNGENISKLGSDFIGKIGYLPQYPRFYKNFTAEEFLRYMCIMKDVSKDTIKNRVSEMLEMVNLQDNAKQYIGHFSGGMRQRLGIAQAMINEPEILLLDEPTAGLDPKERIRFRNLISSFSEKRIVILATHIVLDVEFLAKEILLIKNGRLIADSSPESMLKKMDDKVFLLNVEKNEIESYMSKYTIGNAFYKEGKYCLRIISDTLPNDKAEAVCSSLEDVYLYSFGEASQ